jgi:hypothetical protein
MDYLVQLYIIFQKNKRKKRVTFVFTRPSEEFLFRVLRAAQQSVFFCFGMCELRLFSMRVFFKFLFLRVIVYF